MVLILAAGVFPSAVHCQSPDTILINARKDLEQTQTSGTLTEQGQAWLNCSKAYRQASKFDSALYYGKEALDLFTATNQKDKQAQTLDQLAIVHETMGNFDKALDYNLQTLALLEELKDNRGLAVTHNNLGIVYSNLGNFKKALEFYEKSIRFTIVSGDSVTRANALNNIAIAYYYQHNYNAALIHYRAALALRQFMGDPVKVAESYHNIGDVYLEQSTLDSALYFYSRAFTLSDSMNASYMRMYSRFGMAQAYARQGFKKKGISYGLQAWTYAQQLNVLREKSIISEFLFSNYRNLKQYDSALYFHVAYKAASDSLFNIDNTKAIASLEARASLEKKDLELQNTKKISRQQQYWMVALGAALMTAIVAAILYNRARKKEKTSRIIVEEQKEEIQSQADALQVANAGKDKLFAIIGHDLRGPIGSLKGLLDLVNAGQLSAQEFSALSQTLSGSVDKLFDLVNHLLQWANSQVKGVKPNFQEVDLIMLVRQNIELLNVIAVKKNITLACHGVTNATVWADANMVNVVLRNLISNALKYTSAHGTVEVDIEIPDTMAYVRISDTGIGMTPETIARLFSGGITSTAGTSGEKGTGLGLSLCKDFVEQLGGKLSVTSNPGMGSEFTFTLLLNPPVSKKNQN